VKPACSARIRWQIQNGKRGKVRRKHLDCFVCACIVHYNQTVKRSGLVQQTIEAVFEQMSAIEGDNDGTNTFLMTHNVWSNGPGPGQPFFRVLSQER
jgi:hypothetical protein